MPPTTAPPTSGPRTDAVEAVLEQVVDPCSLAAGTPLSLRDMGLVRSWTWRDGRLELVLCVTAPGCGFVGHMARAATDGLLALDGVREVDVRVDPEVVWDPSWQSDRARALLDARRRRVVELGLRPRQWEESA